MKAKTLILITVFSFITCSEKPKEDSKTPVQESLAPSLVGSGKIEGVVLFKGPIPKGTKNPAASSPDCKASPTDENQKSIRVKSGKLQNVFVYIKDPPAGNYPVQATSQTLNQQSCAYVPRVFGLQVNQPLEILNSDSTLHNVHSLSSNAPFNLGMPRAGLRISKSFPKPEVMVTIKCDVHPWMRAFIGVLPHPFFDTSKEDGSFTISNIPAGTYTLVAWHEKLGEKTQTIAVGDKSTAKIKFDFKP